MANLKKDERQPLSTAIVEAQLLKKHKAFSIATIPLTVLVLLISITLTYLALSQWRNDALPQSILHVAYSLIIWLATFEVLYRVTFRPLMLRRSFARGLVSIEEDEVSYTTEEIKRGGKHTRRVFAVYLRTYGRFEVNKSLWDMLAEGDTVYAAVLHRKKPLVLEVYSTLTHKLISLQREDS